MIFAMAFDEAYSSMAEAVVNALNHFQRQPTIVVYTDEPCAPALRRLAELHPNLHFIPFSPAGYHYGEWHPLIWAKVEAFRLPTQECVMFLDADMIIYNDLSRFEPDFLESGKVIGASRDFAPLTKQFNSGFDFRQFFFQHYFRSESYLTAPALNAGALIFRPDPAVHRELTSLAERHHRVTFYPEQAILNLFCSINDCWQEFPDLSVMPFSRRVADPEPTYGMIHFFTPRPEFMAPPVIREGEPALEQMMAWFADAHGTPYPIRRIEAEYRARQQNTLVLEGR